MPFLKKKKNYNNSHNFSLNFRIFSLAIETCAKHVIATETQYTTFFALQESESTAFRFYTIPEKKFSFAVTVVPETTDNFYAGDFYTFGKSRYTKEITTKNSNFLNFSPQ